MDENENGREWGNLRFRRDRHRRMHSGEADPAQTRFVTRLAVFIAVALIYPWYSYRVQSYLVARDLDVPVEQFVDEIEAASEEVLAEIARREQAAVRQAQVRRQSEGRQRTAGVRVMGITDGRNGLVVVVDLGQASIGQAAAQICSQTERSVGRRLDGAAIRLQRYRGSQPALDAGKIRC